MLHFFTKEFSFSVGAHTETHAHYCIENPGTVLTTDQAAEALIFGQEEC